jgi:hypothetical protein
MKMTFQEMWSWWGLDYFCQVKMYKDKEVNKNVKNIFLSMCDVKVFLHLLHWIWYCFDNYFTYFQEMWSWWGLDYVCHKKQLSATFWSGGLTFFGGTQILRIKICLCNNLCKHYFNKRDNRTTNLWQVTNQSYYYIHSSTPIFVMHKAGIELLP